MRMRLIPLLMIGMFGLAIGDSLPAAEADSAVARWDFNVYVGDKRVGKHYFEVVTSDAREIFELLGMESEGRQGTEPQPAA